MYYYGVIVCFLTGNLTNIEGDYNHKPPTEDGGMSLCYWRQSEKERDEMRDYARKYITGYRETHK